ncbi:GNAT family N-acetyltransferase [Paenibacillus sp. P96]|uniref:GNAT family N-acetyltransferase n=1 Tax=Paenibacillus zeirhizosphaerae TaxID=2987519 RepID=A0ABT9FUC2_9BACL|nr:GNAT family N-acetyltransferase [Paenibacillus sp. P96]MDP4098096.1 GNAT family N-acetyltransferase [Paenibacillus sp. P96]
MITALSLQDDYTLEQLWHLQHVAYRLEAEKIGFDKIPPLMDTLETLRACGEQFYGAIGEDGEIIGAIATETEQPGSLIITRMMVHPGHFRRGLAGSLIEHVVESHREVPLFMVSTGTLNTPAVSLYQKYGFRPVAVQEIAPGVELTTFHLNNMNLHI